MNIIRRLLVNIIDCRLFHFIPDKQFIKIKYRLIMNKKLDLNNPTTFNEKLQWLKLNDKKDIYHIMVDKYEVKKYVSSIIGSEYIIPTIDVFNNFDEIDFNKLPNQFVLKCTHDSGGIVICKDKNQFDIKKARKTINKCLRRNYYYSYREWPYNGVRPRIIIEKYLQDSKRKTMRDYKFFCFNGIPKIMYLSEGLENHSTACMSFFDMNFMPTDCKRRDYKLLNYIPRKPDTFVQMKSFASVLSKGIPHIRVDFYEIDGHLYFGELTFFTCSGMVPFEDDKWDKKMGDWIKLK